MSNLNQAVQLSILQSKLGISLDDLADIVKRTGLNEHSQIRAMFQREYSLGYSEADALTAAVLQSTYKGAR